MEVELRDVIEKNKANVHTINWDSFPVPNIQTDGERSGQLYHHALYGSQSTSKPVQKETLVIPSTLHNQSLLDKIRKETN
jgi:hypothetical protein